MLGALLAPAALPTRLPQLVSAVLGVVVVAVLVAAWRAQRALPARRDQRGGPWWTVLATPFSGDAMADYFIGGLWDLLRGGANVTPAGAHRSEPPLRGAAGRQPRPAGVPRAAGRRARSRCAARRRLRAARPGSRRRVLSARSADRARTAGRRRRSIWRAPRATSCSTPSPARCDPGGHRHAVHRLRPRELLARRDPSALRSAGQPAAGARGDGAGRRAAGHHRRGRRRAGQAARPCDAPRPLRARGSASTSRRRKPRRCATHSRSPSGWFDAMFVVRPGAQPGRRARRRRRVRRAVGSLAVGGRAGRSGIRGRVPPVHRSGRRRQRRRDGAQRHAHERGMTASFSRSRGVFFSGPAGSCRNWSASSSSGSSRRRGSSRAELRCGTRHGHHGLGHGAVPAGAADPANSFRTNSPALRV